MPGRVSTAILLAALAAALAAPPGALAADARYDGVSAAGDAVFFSTADKLAPGDTDIRVDVYVRAFDADVGYFVTRQVSLGPTGGNNAFDAQFLGNDSAGERAFFSTAERLTAADVDGATDIYVRDLTANQTALVSAGDASCAAAGCGTANEPASAVADAVAADGDRVFFASAERLSAQDSDSVADVYVRDLPAGATTLVSAADPGCETGGCGNGPAPAFFQGAADDGLAAVVSTTESLRADDADAANDLYLRDLEAGETRLVSEAGTCPAGLDAGECVPVFGGISAGGAHVFFESKEQVAEADGDEFQDVHDWSGGEVSLASVGSAGGGGESNARYVGASDDGARVFFETEESLEPADADGVQDVYARVGGSVTALVSAEADACAPAGCGGAGGPASLRWASPDGAIAVLSTAERLAPADEDAAFDVYRRELGGDTVLVSRAGASCEASACGNEPENANFAAATAGGSRIFFVSAEQLVAGDGDQRTDVYSHVVATETTELISAADPACGGGFCGDGPHDAQLHGISADGTRAFFVTSERLHEDDADVGERDVYSRWNETTSLMSRSNDGDLESSLAPPAPQLTGTDPASPGASTEPKVIGSEPVSSASIKIYATPDCSGEPVATGDATELAHPGIAAPAAAGETTEFRATAEADGFISLCSNPLPYTQQDAPAEEGDPGEDGSGGDGSGGSGSGGSDGESGGEDPGGGGAGSDGSGGGGGATPKPPAPAPPPTYGDGVRYVAPVTRITFGPAFKTRWRRPAFRFADGTGQPGTRFICRVDRRRWRFCASPIRLRALRRGRHVFKVKAVNAVGAWEPGVVRRSFRMTRTDVRGLRALRRALAERRSQQR